jgi:hypothetical protein
MANTFRTVLVLSALGLGLPWVMADALEAAPPRIAVVDIGFTDSSGETREQGREHATRQRLLTEGLYRQIAQPGRLESLHLDCGTGCALDAAGVEALRQRAQEAGAAFILVGKVHKMSTLVMSMRFAVLDTASGKLVLERLLSFRSDNDDGWRHAGDYAAREVAGALP